MAQRWEGVMREMVAELPLETTGEIKANPAPTQAVAPDGRSLMTPLGLAAGEVLIAVDESGAMTLRQLIRTLDWPVYMVTMAVGMLVRQGLVGAIQRELEVLVQPVRESSSNGHREAR